ncbi:glycosyltransferase family 2 protein [Anaerophaga thermohalophila]|uniref:glycosyltransferase family 2 protein n=1 Tax=Anaerophaga thermohalophila TaxID=177400 RepID=UPI000237D3A0|nr:glycosyltransferase family 2 protein [Anaerophaga thermohalophila]
MTKTPKLSIITVNLNNATGLRKTLDSVATQTFTDYEHLIIDGGSTDESVEVIKEYEKQYNGIENGLYWVSEPDKGIYNAMNKGIKVAKGEYCLFLNSGDWLIEDSLKDLFKHNFNEDIIYTNCYFLKDKINNYIPEIFPNPSELSFDFFLHDMICHQAILFKRFFFDNFGWYDESYKIASDIKIVTTAIVHGNATLKKLDTFLCMYNHDGLSASNRSLYEQEKKQIFSQEFQFFYKDYVVFDKMRYELKAIRNHFLIKTLKKIRTIFQK